VSLKGWQSSLEIDNEFRSAVAELLTKIMCQEAVILALLPHLEEHQKRAIRQRLPDVAASGSQLFLVGEGMDRDWETSHWLRALREALDG
jgi:hypothetical protein